MNRTCTGCHETKPLTQFHNCARGPDGKHRRCIVCVHVARAPRRGKESRKRMETYRAGGEDALNQQRAYQAANRDKYRKACADWRARNPEKQKAAQKRWNQQNSDKNAAAASRYYARKRQRMPAWLSDEQRDHIDLFYLVAAELSRKTGIQHSVDHIIPLHGETVCGLHVPWNLQVLSSADNSRKSNHLTIDVTPAFRLDP